MRKMRFKGYTAWSPTASEGPNENSYQGSSDPILHIIDENELQSPKRSFKGNIAKKLRLELTSNTIKVKINHRHSTSSPPFISFTE